MKVFGNVQFESRPVLIAAWPGMGNVGLIAVDYLRRKLATNVFAELDMSRYYVPDSIVVKDGIARLPQIPSGLFHHKQNPDVIIFESSSQLAGHESMKVIKSILDFAREYQVSRIYTAAAYAQPMSHTDSSEIVCACNSDALLSELYRKGLKIMPDGLIAGMNGLLLGIAASYGIDSACFLGTLPSYASNLSYPKASLKIVDTIQSFLGISLDLSELNADIETLDQRFETIESRIKEFFPSVNQSEEGVPEEMAEIKDDDVPKYIMDRIESLFAAVKTDKTQAKELKDELVRWNLYDLYEDRFLDLFREG